MVATPRAESRLRTGVGTEALKTETETETERRSEAGHSTG